MMLVLLSSAMTMTMPFWRKHCGSGIDLQKLKSRSNLFLELVKHLKNEE